MDRNDDRRPSRLSADGSQKRLGRRMTLRLCSDRAKYPAFVRCFGFFCVARGLGAGMILDAVVSTIDDRKRILSLFCILLRRAERSAISHRYPVSVR